jgi:hypothetical protein
LLRLFLELDREVPPQRAGELSQAQIQFFDAAVAIAEAGVKFAFAKG